MFATGGGAALALGVGGTAFSALSGASAARARGKAEEEHAQRQGEAEREAAFRQAQGVLDEASEKRYEDRLTRAASGLFEGTESYEGTSAQVIDDSNFARAQKFADEIKDRGVQLKKMYEQRGRGLRSVSRSDAATKIIGGVATAGTQLAAYGKNPDDNTKKPPPRDKGDVTLSRPTGVKFTPR